VNPNDIIFYTNPGFVPSIGLPNGNFQVLPPTTGDFAGLNGEMGTVKNLTRAPGDAPPYSLAPSDTAVAIMDFMVLPTPPAMTFELTVVASGPTQDPTAVLCTPANWDLVGTDCYADPGSPFVLQNRRGPTGSIDTYFSLTMSGVAWFTATPAQKSNWTATLGGSVVGKTIGDELKQLALPNGHVDTSIQGSVMVTAVPEPGTVSLFVIGFALLVTSRFRGRNAA